MTYVNHNAFARHELHKETDKTASECSWCGSQPKRLYRYWIENDDSLSRRKNYISGAFCSKGCMNAYHDTDL